MSSRMIYRHGLNDVLWDEEVDEKIVKEYVFWSLISQNFFVLTSRPLHDEGEVVCGVLFLGEL